MPFPEAGSPSAFSFGSESGWNPGPPRTPDLPFSTCRKPRLRGLLPPSRSFSSRGGNGVSRPGLLFQEGGRELSLDKQPGTWFSGQLLCFPFVVPVACLSNCVCAPREQRAELARSLCTLTAVPTPHG